MALVGLTSSLVVMSSSLVLAAELLDREAWL